MITAAVPSRQGCLKLELMDPRDASGLLAQRRVAAVTAAFYLRGDDGRRVLTKVLASTDEDVSAGAQSWLGAMSGASPREER